jgi:hypothetical protein
VAGTPNFLGWEEGDLKRVGDEGIKRCGDGLNHLTAGRISLISPVVIAFETKPTRDFHGFIKLISRIAFLAGKMK